MRPLPELLAPAGNFAAMETAFRFGADAVYAGGKSFSLRAGADNFTDEELSRAVEYAHARGKKFYVAANIFAKDADLGPARKFFRFLASCGADAAIVSDPGLVALCREEAETLPVHLSTQANTLNSAAVRFWARAGVGRVILARELSLGEIGEIVRGAAGTEIEVFVHGAACVSYSGRCLLSNYLNGRDANRGECVQACRWKYSLREYGSDRAGVEVEEDERGTYFLNSKDLALIGSVGRLAELGVKSLKIEGRMKSVYYVATVVNAYRRALDEWAEKGEAYLENPVYREELDEIAHRPYETAFFSGPSAAVAPDSSQTAGRGEFVAVVLSAEGGWIRAEMRGRFREGDELTVLSPGEAFRKKFVVREMTDEAGEPVRDAKLVCQILRIRTDLPVRAGDILRRERE